MAITWMNSFFYEQDKSIAKRLKKFVTRYPEYFAAWSPLAPGEEDNDDDNDDDDDDDDDNDEKGKDENGRELCPFLHYFPPSCCSFALTLVRISPVDFTINMFMYELLQLKSTLVEMLGVIDINGYELDAEVTLLDLRNILHRPKNVDSENGLFIKFFNKMCVSLHSNILGFKILKKRLNSLAKQTLRG